MSELRTCIYCVTFHGVGSSINIDVWLISLLMPKFGFLVVSFKSKLSDEVCTSRNVMNNLFSSSFPQYHMQHFHLIFCNNDGSMQCQVL